MPEKLARKRYKKICSKKNIDKPYKNTLSRNSVITLFISYSSSLPQVSQIYILGYLKYYDYMKITNRRAFYDYEILERFEAGVSLTGAEVKAIRQGSADLTGSFVKIVGSEAYLVNARIFPYKYARPEGYEESRSRKLLLHKSEIIALKSKTEGANLTIVAISLYMRHHLIKVELALAKGKRKFEKREAKKKKDLARDLEEQLKGNY